MNVDEIIGELEKAGSEQTKKVLLRHGAKEPFFGTKVEDIKKIQKKIKDNKQQTAFELFNTGIGEAQYLAALLADGSEMTKKQLDDWARKASWGMISEYSVPWVTSENGSGVDIALKWIDSKDPKIATAGWNALSAIVSVWKDGDLDLNLLRTLLKRVEVDIHDAPNRVRYCMNGFVIALGSFVAALNKEAIAIGKKIGGVEVDMNGTSCKVPFAPDYIRKVMDKGYLGKKRKTAKC